MWTKIFAKIFNSACQNMTELLSGASKSSPKKKQKISATGGDKEGDDQALKDTDMTDAAKQKAKLAEMEEMIKVMKTTSPHSNNTPNSETESDKEPQLRKFIRENSVDFGAGPLPPLGGTILALTTKRVDLRATFKTLPSFESFLRLFTNYNLLHQDWQQLHPEDARLSQLLGWYKAALSDAAMGTGQQWDVMAEYHALFMHRLMEGNEEDDAIKRLAETYDKDAKALDHNLMMEAQMKALVNRQKQTSAAPNKKEKERKKGGLDPKDIWPKKKDCTEAQIKEYEARCKGANSDMTYCAAHDAYTFGPKRHGSKLENGADCKGPFKPRLQVVKKK